MRAPTRTRTWNPLVKSQLLYQNTANSLKIRAFDEHQCQKRAQLSTVLSTADAPLKTECPNPFIHPRHELQCEKGHPKFCSLACRMISTALRLYKTFGAKARGSFSGRSSLPSSPLGLLFPNSLRQQHTDCYTSHFRLNSDRQSWLILSSKNSAGIVAPHFGSGGLYPVDLFLFKVAIQQLLLSIFSCINVSIV